MNNGWYGVDLDGTLAVYSRWVVPGAIGAPVPMMVERVKRWLAEGKDVRIMTARVDGLAEEPDPEVPRRAIECWCLENLGRVLPVTNRKDMHMIELWDDRAVQVIPNTGIAVTACGCSRD